MSDTRDQEIRDLKARIETLEAIDADRCIRLDERRIMLDEAVRQRDAAIEAARKAGVRGGYYKALHEQSATERHAVANGGKPTPCPPDEGRTPKPYDSAKEARFVDMHHRQARGEHITLDEFSILYGGAPVGVFTCAACGADWPHIHDRKGNPVLPTSGPQLMRTAEPHCIMCKDAPEGYMCPWLSRTAKQGGEGGK